MPYLDQFITAIAFLEEFEKPTTPIDKAAAREYLIEFQSTRMQRANELVLRAARQLAQRYVERTPDPLANRCHTVSYSFRETFLMNPLFGGVPHDPCITVGNVFHRGVSLFPTTRDSLRAMIEAGPQPGRDMATHVWITFPDMTVFDLTLLPTLRRRGDHDGPDDLLVWHPSAPGDFVFEPLLVDNRFPERVDTLTSIVYR